MIALLLACVILIIRVTYCENIECNLDANLLTEIRSYGEVVQQIEKHVMHENSPFKNFTWNKLADFVDDFGSRLTGSQNLENAISFLSCEFVKNGLENVHYENASVPRWSRNSEWAVVKKPRGIMRLSMLGLGGSVGTSKNGVEGPVMVVQSQRELLQLRAQVPGKIVVFDSYYPHNGVNKASRLGAVAVFLRSTVSDFDVDFFANGTQPISLGTPHAGVFLEKYDSDVKRIPVASLSLENVQMLHRLYKRGVPLRIHLYMGAKSLPMMTSRNLVGEIRGSVHPEKVVVVSGHIDSWDVGQGAIDDGGGAFVSWVSLAMLQCLNLRPKRTIRVILWTGEEQGLYGAKSYLKHHKSELKNFVLMMESDFGTFSPTGFFFSGWSNKAFCIMEEVLKLMTPFNATDLKKKFVVPTTDITVFNRYDIPQAYLKNADQRYLWFHHSAADSMAIEDPLSLDRSAGLLAATAYVIADLGIELPRFDEDS